MNTNSPEHKPFVEMMPAYVMDGLDPADRASLESHLALCAACRQTLADITAADQSLAKLFQGVAPDVGFEDRVIGTLRTGGRSPRLVIHPMVYRIGSGIAAALVLAGVGAAASGILDGTAGKPKAEAPRMLASGVGTRVESSPPTGGEGKYNYRWAESDRAGAGQGSADNLDADKDLKELAKGNLGERVEDREKSWNNRSFQRPDGNQQGQAVDALKYNESNGRGDAVNFSYYSRQLDWSKTPDEGENVGKGVKVPADYVNDVIVLNIQPPNVVTGGGAPQQGYVSDLEAVTGDGVGLFNAVVDGRGAVAGITGTTPDKDKQSGAVRGGAVALGINGASAGRGFTTGGVGGAGAAVGVPFGTSTGAKAAEGVTLGRFFKPTDLYADIAGVREGDGEVGAKLSGLTEETAGEKFGFTAADPKPNPNAPDTTPPVTSVGQAEKPPTQPPIPPPVVQQRKIIRNGEMEFEVESFDSSYLQIAKIVTEEGGFVSSTDSEKLANGKVRGTVVVRVLPERLDTLVLKLRALGDLRGQRIAAQDVTKKYHDLAAELRASKAMEERLLNIIKSGKGEIKDLIEAEKQYGVYREKSEKLEGEIRYYDNLVSLSTLTITAVEKDIKTPALAAQTENVQVGIVVDEVEKTRADALKVIDEAKGRVIASDLKKHDAGQLSATIIAEVSPDAAGPTIDRLRQLGHVARLDIERKQTTPAGQGAPAPTRVERKDTRLVISIYNLANIAARQTTSVQMAVPNVEEAYRAILETVRAKGGRIVASNLNRQKAEQTTAGITFEVPTPESDATLVEIRRDREVMSINVTENPDTQNVTAAKRAFSLSIYSTATVAPRETENLTLTTRGELTEAFRKLADEARKADARILVSQLNDQDKSNLSAALEVEVLRTKEADFRAAIASTGVILARTVQRSSDAENTIDSKVRLSLRLVGLDRLAPRETQSLNLAAKDVPSAFQSVLASVHELGGRVIASNLNEQSKGAIQGQLDFEIPAEKRDATNKALDAAGVVFSRQVQRSNDTQNTVDLKFRMQVKLGSVDQLPPRETTTLKVEVSGVEDKTESLRDAAFKAGGRILQYNQSTDGSGKATSRVILDVPLAKADEVRARVLGMGKVRERAAAQDPQTPDGQHARAHLDVTLVNEDQIVADDQGLSASFRNALSMSVKGLLLSLQFIVIGLLIVGPWALIAWFAHRVYKKNKAAPITVPAS